MTALLRCQTTKGEGTAQLWKEMFHVKHSFFRRLLFGFFFRERFWQWLVRLFSFIVMELIWRGFAPPNLPTQGESPL